MSMILAVTKILKGIFRLIPTGVEIRYNPDSKEMSGTVFKY